MTDFLEGRVTAADRLDLTINRLPPMPIPREVYEEAKKWATFEDAPTKRAITDGLTYDSLVNAVKALETPPPRRSVGKPKLPVAPPVGPRRIRLEE